MELRDAMSPCAPPSMACAIPALPRACPLLCAALEPPCTSVADGGRDCVALAAAWFGIACSPCERVLSE